MSLVSPAKHPPDDDDLPDDADFESLQAKRTWRREVVSNGRYWIWRKGSGKRREYKFGGKFDTLPQERQTAYYVNRAAYHFYREQAAARDGRTYRPRNTGERPELLH